MFTEGKKFIKKVFRKNDLLSGLNGLLDFLPSIVFELVRSGDILLGPFDVLVGVPVPDYHDILSLLFFLLEIIIFFLGATLNPRSAA